MYTIQIQQGKIVFFKKKKKIFYFFYFQINAQGPPNIFDIHFFKKKKKQKMNLLGPGKCENKESHEFW